mmetsp:Transcript_15220/g.42913  ORF Transcript_15220/g.42913 Transcript_15220/m.42913 type:complete len:279 (+) Transcript_15220:563-1399(+)
MRDGKEDHFDADAVIDQTIRDFFAGPLPDVFDDAVTLQVKDDNTLPPGEEHDALHAQELPERVPVDGISQVFADDVEEHDETVEGVHDAAIQQECHVRVRHIPPELSLAVHFETLESEREECGDGLDDDVLQHPVLRLHHEFHPQLPRLEHKIEGEGMLCQMPRAVPIIRDLASQGADQRILTAQQLDEVVDETRNHVGLVQIPNRVDVNSCAPESQAEPALDGVERHHPKDADDVLLDVGHVPVREVQVHQSNGEDDRAEHHHSGRFECCEIELAPS